MTTRNLLRARRRLTTTRRVYKPRLRLESLEDRTLLSGYVHPLHTLFPSGGIRPLGSSGPTGYTPAQMRHAYGFDQIVFPGNIPGDGEGMTIAIVNAFDNPRFVSSTDPNYVNSDLHKFNQQFGLPDPPRFTKVNQNGGTTYPPTDPNWAAETALDVEWAHALAPKANILLVEATDNSYLNMLSAVRFAASRAGVVVVSMSWGSSEFSAQSANDSSFVTPSGHPGVTFVAASGDFGAPPSYPAISPNVLSIGGTSLVLDPEGNILSEFGWGNNIGSSGGGISAYVAQPDYQKGVVTQSTTRRTNPDVAYNADPYTGFPVYDSFNNAPDTPWSQFGGTSAGAPQWAALIAIVNQGRALLGKASLDGRTETLPMIYRLPAADFHDMTTGGSLGTPQYTAGPGYDLVTGIGSPIAYRVVVDLAGITAGAAVASQSPTGTVLAPLSSIQVTFNAQVQASTFDSTDITAFSGPGSAGGFIVTAVNPDSNGRATTFTIRFANALTTAGSYSFRLGPNILDANNNPMDQNHNGAAGETGDFYQATFVIGGPAIVSSTPTGNQTPGVTKVHVTFNTPVSVSSFDKTKITAFTRNGTSILGDIASVVSTGGTTTSKDFDITFTGAGAVLGGAYALTIGPNITDTFGNPMASAYTATFTIVVIPPAVVAFTPAGGNPPIVSRAQVTFNQPILISSFTTADIGAFTRNGTSILADIAAVVATNPIGTTATQFDITFADGKEFATGTYSMSIGPSITDPFGNPMAAAHTGTFSIDGPRVTALSPSGTIAAPVSSATVTFNRAMLAATFTSSQVTLTGPGNVVIPVTVTPVNPVNGAATQFTLSFAAQNLGGVYTTVIGPNVRDIHGNAMDQNGNFLPGESVGDRFSGSWTILGSLGGDAFGYTASAYTYQDLEIAGQPGTFTIISSGDDITGTVNLGANTFNMYGKVVNTLYVSSNGLISLSGPDSRFNSQDLRIDGGGPLIAPLWDDWAKLTGSAMVVGQYRDFVNGKPTHLVIEWNQVIHFPSSRAITFQVQLDLNTGGNTANILFNYQDIDTQDASANGQRASVGIKDAGSQFSTNNVMPVSYRQASPFLGSGQAILIYAPPYGATVTGSVYNDVNHNGSRGGAEAGLQGWTIYADVNNNGILDADEPSAVTDASGNYTLTSVLPGSVRLREVLRSGWARSQPGSPGAYVFTAGVRETITGRDFGNYSVTALSVVDNQDAGFATTGAGWSTVTGGGYQGSYAAHAAAGQVIAGPEGYGYRAVKTGFQSLTLAGDPSAFSIINSADDAAAAVDLGNRSFTFYGQRFTGNNQLFVSSNGLITLGSANASSFAGDLTTSPSQYAIAPLWNDWSTGPGTPMVLGKFDDANNRLIIEWNKVRHYPGFQGTGITFQAILSLDGAGIASDIVFNYVNLTGTGVPGDEEGAGSTVGIKAASTQGPLRLLISSAGVNVASGQAIRITTNATTSNAGTASWTVTPAAGAGAYEVFATWVALASNATNAAYKIYDGAPTTGKLLATVVVDQTQAPGTALVNGSTWDKLGTFSTTTGRFTIVTDSATINGLVSADAVFVAAAPVGGSGISPLLRSAPAGNSGGTAGLLGTEVLVLSGSQAPSGASPSSAPAGSTWTAPDPDVPVLDQLFSDSLPSEDLFSNSTMRRTLPGRSFLGDPLNDLFMEEPLARLTLG